MTTQQLIQETIKRGVKFYSNPSEIETSWTMGIVKEVASDSNYSFHNTDVNELSDEIYLIACQADEKIENILKS